MHFVQKCGNPAAMLVEEQPGRSAAKLLTKERLGSSEQFIGANYQWKGCNYFTRARV
jgi:hypothetical protein